MAQEGIEKSNPLVDFMRDIQAVNAAAGAPAGRGYRGGPPRAEQPTRVRSGAMSAPPVPLKPLTPEEKAELDRKAQEIGILPKPEKDELDELNETEDDAPPPAPSAPVGAAALIPKPGSVRRATPPSQINVAGGRGIEPVTQRPQLPDFKKVQLFDLQSGTIVVDGMFFPIPAEDVRAMKAYAVSIALDHVVMQLAKALIEFGVPEAAAMEAADKLRESVDGRKENMQEVRGGEGAGRVPSEPGAEAGLGVPPVPPPGAEGLQPVSDGGGEPPQE